MPILDIRVLGDPILREQTRPVPEITDEIRTLVENMFETMHAADGIGIAAPQVGRSERIAVIEIDGIRYVLINPEIVSRGSRTEREEEGCLSIPEIMGSVDRPATIVLRALDLEGNEYEIEADGLLARCIQHEVDHLDGKLFIDYFSLLKRRTATKKWEKEVSQYPNYIRKLEPPPAGATAHKRRRPTPEAEQEQAGETLETPASPDHPPEL